MAPETGQIDQLDVQLMEALREDPRVGLLEIARRVGVARGTGQGRLPRVQERGGIAGQARDVEGGGRGEFMGVVPPGVVFVFAELTQGRLTEAAEAARAVPEVLE